MIGMNEFKERIKGMCKTKEKEDTKEREYEHFDIIIVDDAVNGDTFICTKESLESDKEYTKKISANNIEDGKQVAEYRVNALPAGRACFGGYTDKECNKGKRLYGFSDVWYKIYGKPLQSGRRFTRNELITLSQEISEKLKDAKFTYIYSIKCKNLDLRKDKFEGTKYFVGYLKENEEIERFEMIDDDSLCIQSVGRNEEGNLIIKIGNQQIDTEGYVLDSSTVGSKKSEFEIELIDSMGISRLYNRAKFTKEACRNIAKNHEKERIYEGR